MRRTFINCSGLIGLASVTLGISAPNFLPALAQSRTTPNSQTQQSLSRLADGNYFYGTSRAAYKSGSDYLIFRKTGNTLTGMKYPVPGETTCFKGTASSNRITNVFIHFKPLGEENSAGEFKSRNPINVNGYYKLAFGESPDFAKKGLQECLRIFSKKK